MTDHECPICYHAEKYGRWPDELAGSTHDRDTHVTFPGTQVWGSCSRCGNMFRGIRTFDDHQDARPSLCDRLKTSGVTAWDDDAETKWDYLKVSYLRIQHPDGWWYYGTTGQRTR